MIFSKRNTIKKKQSKQKIIVVVRQKSKHKVSLFQGTIDYKNVVLLRKFLTAEGKILPRRVSGLNAKQQRYMSKAIKNARMIGFIPYIKHSQPFRF
uniref:Small ribosomal subunit protein bS18c n=1 Tax=Neglectella solitaria TaxID=120749 RepID=C7BEH1_NEGSO|nr:ribosomal protein S18 [Neglectella solitaria]